MWQCPKCGRDFEKTNQSHSCSEIISTIDEYISAQPENIRPLLKKIRKTIKKAVPDAVEKISWRMPTFWQGENLIHFAAFKKHIGIFPGELSQLPFKQRLKNYKTTKGAIHFPFDKPIDYELIADIACFRASGKIARKSGK
jgi:uncharacterized protein YdhG (YjbR/CyaY superfamily)